MTDMDFMAKTSPWLSNPKFRYKVIKRDRYALSNIKTTSRLVKILLGTRRVGKPSILFSFINELLDQGNHRNIFFIPADLYEVRLMGIRATIENLADIYKFDVFKKEIFFFIDEVQEVKDLFKPNVEFIEFAKFL